MAELNLDHIFKLEDGWFNGEGAKYNKEEVLRFKEILEQRWIKNFPIPVIFPMVNGNLSLEWQSLDCVLELDLKTLIANGHLTTSKDNGFVDICCDFNNKLSEVMFGIRLMVCDYHQLPEDKRKLGSLVHTSTTPK